MLLPAMSSATRKRMLLSVPLFLLIMSFIFTLVYVLSPPQHTVFGIVVLVLLALAAIILAGILTPKCSIDQQVYEDLESDRTLDLPRKPTAPSYKIALRGDDSTHIPPVETFSVCTKSGDVAYTLDISRSWSLDEAYGIVLVFSFSDQEINPITQWGNLPSQKPILLLYGDKLLESLKMHATEREWSYGPLHEHFQHLEKFTERVHYRNASPFPERGHSQHKGLIVQDNTPDVRWDLRTFPHDITPSDGIHIVYLEGEWTDVLISEPIIFCYQYCGFRVEFDESHWTSPPKPDMRRAFRRNAMTGIEKYGIQVGDAYRSHPAYRQSQPWIDWSLFLAATKRLKSEAKVTFARRLVALNPSLSRVHKVHSLDEQILARLEKTVIGLLTEEIELDTSILSPDVLELLWKALQASSQAINCASECPAEHASLETQEQLYALLSSKSSDCLKL